MSQQDDFFNQAKAQLDNWNEELKKIQSAAMDMQSKGQEQFQKQLDAMNEQRKAAEKQLEEIGAANAAAWKDMQAGFEKAWKSMEDSMTEARKRFE